MGRERGVTVGRFANYPTVAAWCGVKAIKGRAGVGVGMGDLPSRYYRVTRGGSAFAFRAYGGPRSEAGDQVRTAQPR